MKKGFRDKLRLMLPITALLFRSVASKCVPKFLKIPVFCLKLGPISPCMPKLEVQFGAPDFVPLCDPRPFHLTSKDGKRSHIIDGCVCVFPGRDRGGEGPGQAFYEVRIITRHGENAGL